LVLLGQASHCHCLLSLTNWYEQVSAMSMARDVTDSSPAQPQSSSSRLANETAASSGSGPGRGPSRRNSRRALTERALAEGAARTRSKGVRARESRMSLASNSGTASPPVMSPGLLACWHYCKACPVTHLSCEVISTAAELSCLGSWSGML